MLRLITIPMSHYCEKARWGLRHAGLDYVEEAHLQVFHYLAVRSHQARGMVPVLVTERESVADSTAILKFIDRSLPESRRLYPEQHADEIDALEDYFDEHLGIETRRWVYFHWQQMPKAQVLQTAAQGTPAWQRSLAPLLFPLMLRYLAKYLALSPENIRHGAQVINAAFDAVAARLQDGRPFLCGDRFTAADISFASMAAPILLPPEYGIRLPGLDEAPAPARVDILKFRAHPAGIFALRLFREHRRQPAC